jgi:methionyl aminopeptidase
MGPVPPTSAVIHNVDYNAISVKRPISARLQELTPEVPAHSPIVDKYGAEIDREVLSGRDSNEFASISIAHNNIAANGEPSEAPPQEGHLFGVDVNLKKDPKERTR